MNPTSRCYNYFVHHLIGTTKVEIARVPAQTNKQSIKLCKSHLLDPGDSQWLPKASDVDGKPILCMSRSRASENRLLAARELFALANLFDVSYVYVAPFFRKKIKINSILLFTSLLFFFRLLLFYAVECRASAW